MAHGQSWAGRRGPVPVCGCRRLLGDSAGWSGSRRSFQRCTPAGATPFEGSRAGFRLSPPPPCPRQICRVCVPARSGTRTRRFNLGAWTLLREPRRRVALRRCRLAWSRPPSLRCGGHAFRLASGLGAFHRGVARPTRSARGMTPASRAGHPMGGSGSRSWGVSARGRTRPAGELSCVTPRGLTRIGRRSTACIARRVGCAANVTRDHSRGKWAARGRDRARRCQ